MAHIWLNRPEVLNAYNMAMRDELYEALGAIAEDDDVAVALLRGRGRSFCAGADLTEFGTAPLPSHCAAGALAARYMGPPARVARPGDMRYSWALHRLRRGDGPSVRPQASLGRSHLRHARGPIGYDTRSRRQPDNASEPRVASRFGPASDRRSDRLRRGSANRAGQPGVAHAGRR